MADYLKSYLGDLLFTDAVDENRQSLPSPEELKRKILVGIRNKTSYNISKNCSLNYLLKRMSKKASLKLSVFLFIDKVKKAYI
jgi:hypothetical protein